MRRAILGLLLAVPCAGAQDPDFDGTWLKRRPAGGKPEWQIRVVSGVYTNRDDKGETLNYNRVGGTLVFASFATPQDMVRHFSTLSDQVRNAAQKHGVVLKNTLVVYQGGRFLRSEIDDPTVHYDIRSDRFTRVSYSNVIIGRYEKAARVWMDLAESYAKGRNYAEALAHYQKALADAPNDRVVSEKAPREIARISAILSPALPAPQQPTILSANDNPQTCIAPGALRTTDGAVLLNFVNRCDQAGFVSICVEWQEGRSATSQGTTVRPKDSADITIGINPPPIARITWKEGALTCAR